MNVIVSNRYQSILDSLEIDVIKKVTGEYDVDALAAMFQNFFFNRMVLDVTALKDYKDPKTLQKLSMSLDVSKIILLLDDSVEASSDSYISQIISIGIYNFTKNIEGVMYLYNNPNGYRDVAHMHDINKPEKEVVTNTVVYGPTQGRRVIGVKNITRGAGATTLIYMMKKELAKVKDVVALETDKRDFQFFRDKDLISTDNNSVANELVKYMDKDVVLIDINESQVALSLCPEVLYLIEPSTIKLNRLMLTNSKVLPTLKDKMVILNKSILSESDVKDFAYEAKLDVFYNLPCLDERDNKNEEIIKLLTKLGFDL